MVQDNSNKEIEQSREMNTIIYKIKFLEMPW